MESKQATKILVVVEEPTDEPDWEETEGETIEGSSNLIVAFGHF